MQIHLLISVSLLLSFIPVLRAGEDADFQRAKGYYTLQEYQMAVEALTKFGAAYPKSERAEDVQLILAESFFQLKQYANAAKAFDAFISKFPQSPRRPDALLRAVKSYAAEKNFESCLKYAELFTTENRAKLKTAPPQDPLHIKFATALYHLGDSAYALKDPNKAQASWEELIQIMPNSPLVPDASYGLGWIYFEKKIFDKAASAFHAAAEVPQHPRAAWAKLMEGRSLAGTKLEDALAAIKQAPTLSGGGPELEAECELRKTEILLNAGRLDDALDGARKLAKLGPTLPASVPALAGATLKFYDAKRFNEAAELAHQYLLLSPDNPNRPAIARIQARAFKALGKTADAVAAAKLSAAESKSLENVAQKLEDRPASLMLLAELSPADAPACYSEIIAQFGQTRYAYSAHYESARLAGEVGKLDEAYEHIKLLLDTADNFKDDSPGFAQLKRDALFAQGEFLFRKPAYKMATASLLLYLKKYPGKDERNLDITRKLAWCHHELGDFAAAIALLDSDLAEMPKNDNLAEMLYIRGLCLQKTDHTADALKSFESLLKDFPKSPFADNARFDSAAIHYKNKQLDACLFQLDTLLSNTALKATLKEPALQLRASARLQTGKTEGALADADELLKSAPADSKLNLPALRLIKALSLLAANGKESEALSALNTLIEKGPPDSVEVRQGISRRAHLLFKLKKFAEAKADFLVISETANAASTQEAAEDALRLVVIHRELKEQSQAKALLEKLATQKLAGVAAFEVPSQLGNLLFEANDNAAAVKQYEKAISAINEKIPTDAQSAARLNLAWALTRVGEKDKAEKAFADLLKADPTGPYAAESLFERGRLLSEQSKAADALLLWKELVEKFASSSYTEKALFLLGQAYAQTGDFKSAAERFEQHAEMFPAISLKESLCGLAESRLHLNEMEKARDAFNKVLGPKGLDADLDDTCERALLGLADIALKAGDASGAKKSVLRILTENPNSEWADAAYFISGQASEALKEPERAIGYYRKLVTERPKSAHIPAAQERLRALGAPK